MPRVKIPLHELRRYANAEYAPRDIVHALYDHFVYTQGRIADADVSPGGRQRAKALRQALAVALVNLRDKCPMQFVDAGGDVGGDVDGNMKEAENDNAQDQR